VLLGLQQTKARLTKARLTKARLTKAYHLERKCNAARWIGKARRVWKTHVTTLARRLISSTRGEVDRYAAQFHRAIVLDRAGQGAFALAHKGGADQARLATRVACTWQSRWFFWSRCRPVWRITKATKREVYQRKGVAIAKESIRARTAWLGAVHRRVIAVDDGNTNVSCTFIRGLTGPFPGRFCISATTATATTATAAAAICRL